VSKNEKLILCVDDQRDSVKFLIEWLRLQKYEVKAATSCAAALSIVQSNLVALSILDAQLCDGNGFDLCKTILAISPATKVIIYSGDTRPEMETRAKAVGAKGFLGKPINLEAVTTVVKKLIG
jgi:DNA-binding NtrC family response regulator